MTTAFYNRESELAKLKQVFGRADAQFVVVYGRRRTGKSTLLRKIVTENDIYHQAVVGDFSLAQNLLARDLSVRFPGFDRGQYTSWIDFFEALIARGGERFTLVLDEFPFMVTAERSLPSILQRLLEDRKRLNFNLVLYGKWRPISRFTGGRKFVP